MDTGNACTYGNIMCSLDFVHRVSRFWWNNSSTANCEDAPEHCFNFFATQMNFHRDSCTKNIPTLYIYVWRPFLPTLYSHRIQQHSKKPQTISFQPTLTCRYYSPVQFNLTHTLYLQIPLPQYQTRSSGCCLGCSPTTTRKPDLWRSLGRQYRSPSASPWPW